MPATTSSITTASRGAKASFPRGNEARSCPCAYAPPQPHLSASTAGRGLVGSELSPLGTAQCHSSRGPHGGVSSLWRGSRHGEGAWPGAEASGSSGSPPGHGAHASFGPDVLVGVVRPAQPASLVHPSVPQRRLQRGRGQMAVPLCRVPPTPCPAGPRLPPCHLHGSCSRGRVRAPRGTREDLRLHVLQAFCPLSLRWLQDGRHGLLLRRGQSQSSGVFMRRNSLKRLTRPAVN